MRSTIPCTLCEVGHCAYPFDGRSTGSATCRIVLSLASSLFAILVCIMDPGILPRLPPSEAYLRRQLPMCAPPSCCIQLHPSVTAAEWNRQECTCRSRAVPFKGHVITTKYDDTYHMYRPLRAHHCRVTNVVIDRFDHFCPWMGNTIGGRNYRAFLLFLVFTTADVLASLAFCALHIVQHVDDVREQNRAAGQEEESVREAILDILGTPILAIFLIGAPLHNRFGRSAASIP